MNGQIVTLVAVGWLAGSLLVIVFVFACSIASHPTPVYRCAFCRRWFNLKGREVGPPTILPSKPENGCCPKCHEQHCRMAGLPGPSTEGPIPRDEVRFGSHPSSEPSLSREPISPPHRHVY